MTECPTCHAKLPERKGLYICPKCGCKWYEKQSQRKPLIKEIEIIEIGKVKENGRTKAVSVLWRKRDD
jgi:uncharacterized Zn finger protein (UPF0148 family)